MPVTGAAIMPYPVANPDHDLYETDFYAWTQAQAAKLRRLEEQAVNLDLDLPRLAEEIEDLGKAERNALRSQVRRLLEHCLKLEFSRAAMPRAGWRDSILDARAELADRVSASLRRDLEGRLPVLFRQTRERVANALRSHGEGDLADLLPLDCPYSLDDLLRDGWYPANRHGRTE